MAILPSLAFGNESCLLLPDFPEIHQTRPSVSSGNQQKPIRPVSEVQLFFSKAAPMAFDGLGIYILQFFASENCKMQI